MLLRNLRELYQYRALLWSLIQREMKARYRGSMLGFLWTFLNPTLLMIVYAIVFDVYMRQNIPQYTFYMFVGLLPWIWFSSSVGSGASAISDRRDLLTKVRFPAQVLPATVVLTNLINFLLSLPLMVGLGLFFQHVPTWHAVAFPLVVLVQLMFTLALSYLISALNVAFRDLQHLISNLLTFWFFLTPIIYTANTIPKEIRTAAVLINPMAVLVTAYQAIFYEHRMPDFTALGLVGLVSAVLLWFATSIFERRREEFAELA
jgi:lipopolysaccharide transport system permease protein